MLTSFDWHAGDHAGYVFGDGDLAVRLARAGRIGADIETRGLGAKAYAITAVSIGTADTAVVLDPTDAGHRRAIVDALSAASTIWFHNASFDAPSLRANGLMPASAISHVVDTVITARLVDPGERISKRLGECCARYLGEEYGVWKSSLEAGFKAVTGMTKAQMFEVLGISSPAFVAYSAFDSVMAARLAAVLPAKVTTYGDADPLHLLRREQTVNRLLLARTSQGIHVDLDVIDELKADMRRQVAEADAVLQSYGVDVEQSAPKIKESAVDVLDRLGVIPARHPRLKNGRPSADAKALSKLGGHPVITALEARSRAERFATDYADKVVALAGFDGRVRPSVNILAATTGRMSIGNPPLQQFPPQVRRMLRFDRPVTSLDWASIEPTFAANVFGDTDVIAEFEAGGDIYLPVAEAAGVTRKVAKVVLLAQLYGEGAPSLANDLGITVDEARELSGRVMARMPKIRDGVRKVRRMCDQLGWVATVSGRRLPLDLDLRAKERFGATRYHGYKGPNFLIQGSCYDLLSEALYEIHRQGLGDAVEFAVHDELLVATEAADQIDAIMRTPPPAFVAASGRVPVLRTGRSDLGRHWEPKES